MKRLIRFILITSVFFSCTKEKGMSIVGTWVENASYGQNDRGEFTWGSASRWPLVYTFTGDGKYSSFQEMSGSDGVYLYSPSTKTLKFAPTGSGSLTTFKVSLLDGTYLIIDNPYFPGGKTKFKKDQ